MNEILDFTLKLAIKAGQVLLSYYQACGISQETKDDNTIVTEADFAADQVIRTAIRNSYPQDGILSEEKNTTYPFGKRFVWIVDPLDGTTNFSLGLHYWGVLITRLDDGVPDLAVLNFPLLNEIYTAKRGAGATLNDHQLLVDPASLSKLETFFSCCSRTHRHYHVDIPYKTRILGSAGYGLSTIARGSASLAFEVTPKVWDFSGSWLIIQEANGYIAPLEDCSIFPLQPGVDYQKICHPILAASTINQWQFGRQHLRSKQL